MKTKMRFVTSAAGVAALVSAANAGITFSDIAVTAGFEDNISWVTSNQDIDFIFDSTMNVLEGAPVDPLSIEISYNAWSMQPMTQDTMVLSVLGGLLGTGTIEFSEQIFEISEDAGDNLLVDYSVVLTADDDLPHVADLMFAHPASHFRVVKTITLSAPAESAGIDLASISLVEQRFVPTPGAAVLAGLAGLASLRRRR